MRGEEEEEDDEKEEEEEEERYELILNKNQCFCHMKRMILHLSVSIPYLILKYSSMYSIASIGY